MGGSLFHWLSHKLEIWDFNRGQKSVQGIRVGEGQQNEEVDLAMESAISLPFMPEWPGTQRNSTIKSERESSYRSCLILMEVGEGRELKKSEERLRRLDKESETMRKLLGGRVEMVEMASKIAKHSVVKEEAEGGRLLDMEMCKSGMKKA